MPGNCESCVHWHNPWTDWDDYHVGRKVADEAKPRWGTCKKIEMPESGHTVESDTIAFVTDGSEYTADLHTRNDFGCVLWTEKVDI